MISWEYKIIRPADFMENIRDRLGLENHLNHLGQDGWELFSTNQIPKDGCVVTWWIFKRPKEQS